MCHSYNKNRKNLLIICPILILQGCKEFKEKYPDYDDYDSKRNSQYNTIVYEAMGGKGDNDYEKDTKIIKKIAKVVGIEKC
jgi:hypothetical protein